MVLISPSHWLKCSLPAHDTNHTTITTTMTTITSGERYESMFTVKIVTINFMLQLIDKFYLNCIVPIFELYKLAMTK
jgi:hypothetical protein